MDTPGSESFGRPHFATIMRFQSLMNIFRVSIIVFSGFIAFEDIDVVHWFHIEGWKFDINKKSHSQVRMACMLGGGGGIRTPGTISRTSVFKTGALNQLCHSSE